MFLTVWGQPLAHMMDPEAMDHMSLHVLGPRKQSNLLVNFSFPFSLSVVCMAEAAEWWLGGRKGTMCPWVKAKVYGLHTAANILGTKVSNKDIRKVVKKIGGGKPTLRALRDLRDIFDEDPGWYPGKCYSDGKPGPKMKFTEKKQQAVAKAAMALKNRGYEPTVAAVVAECPSAAINPDTGLPWDKKLIAKVYKTKCYDLTPDNPWLLLNPLSKSALPDWLEEHRKVWGKNLLANNTLASWYQRNVVWWDPCSSIVPSAPRAIFNINKANQPKCARWMSKDARYYSRNLRASPYSGKQASWGGKRVWWFIIFTRDQVRLPIMDMGWKQNGVGMAKAVPVLDKLLDGMSGSSPKPRVVFSDRGPGFYNTGNGIITKAYRTALEKHNFRPFAGNDASHQPADIADILLHESVAAGIRKYFKGHPIKWTEDQDKNLKLFAEKLKSCEKHINKNHNLKSLSLSFPNRVKKLVKEKGRRQPW